MSKRDGRPQGEAEVKPGQLLPAVGHLGSRLCALDMIRFAEQAAVLASDLGGLSAERTTTQSFRHLLVPPFLGSLRHAACHSRIVTRDTRDCAAETKAAWRPYGPRVPKLVLRNGLPDLREFKVDLVCSPIDGVTALREGRSSSAVAIAGGEEGAFIERSTRPSAPNPGSQSDLDAARYFVVVTATRGLTNRPALRASNALLESPAGVVFPPVPEPNDDVDRYLSRTNLVPTLLDNVHKRGKRPTLGFSAEGRSNWSLPLDINCPRVRLEGSSVGAAVTGLLRKGGIDVVCMFSRRCQAMIIAAACRALGATGYFFPIQDEGTCFLPGLRRVLTPTDLVTGQHVFVVLTGITTGRAVAGVEWHEGNQVTVHSIVLSTLHQSVRRVRHRFDLERVMFVNAAANPVTGKTLLDQFGSDARAQFAARASRSGSRDA